MQQAQIMMVVGFILLGWVLAKRQLRFRARVNRDTRDANRELKRLRRGDETVGVPLASAPPDVQRWQAEMLDLQRELTAEMDTRIAILQSLIARADDLIARNAQDRSST